MRVLLIMLSLVAASTMVAPSASALTVRRTWNASVGTSGANGTAKLLGYVEGIGWMHAYLKRLRANTAYRPYVFKGKCGALGTLITTLPSFRSTATGTFDYHVGISGTKMNAIWKVARYGPIAVRFGTGTLARCGTLRHVLSTRVVIGAYGIDLPVVRPPGGSSGYPLCNVAMFMQELYQPPEPGVTMLYAHARTGMFLKLLQQSKINNGAGMLGKIVKVYTSNNKLYTYKITRVRRHITSILSAFSINSRQLWLQTSEGYQTPYKLVIVAKPVAVYNTTYAAAHPTPRPVRC